MLQGPFASWTFSSPLDPLFLFHYVAWGMRIFEILAFQTLETTNLFLASLRGLDFGLSVTDSLLSSCTFVNGSIIAIFAG